MFNILFGFLLLARFWQLGLKPVHHDESINGWFVEQLWKTGNFHYDPSNYHGPLLFYLFQVAEGLGGWGVASFRFVTVLFSVMTVLWLYNWMRSRFDLSGWWLLGLLLSPAFLFFSRSAIHESVLVFFLTMATTAWIDVWCLRKPEKLPWILYGLTGMMLLKETFIIPLALAFLCSAPLLIRKEKWRALIPQKERFFFHLLICVGLWALFFSSFGGNPQGLLDFFRAFLPWAKTGTEGNGHEKYFWYFPYLMWLFEPATIVALALTIVGLLKNHWVRGVCAWALLTLIAYSIVPYKTPWCILSIQVPLWIAAGLVLAKGNFLLREGGQVVLVLAGLCSAASMYHLNYEKLPDHHMYVYVQSSWDAKIFAESLIQQSKDRPEIRNAEVQWATEEPWPFPWWLSAFPHQASQQLSQGWNPKIDLLLIDETETAQVEPNLHDRYWKAHFQVRDARIPAVAYLKKSLFSCPLEHCDEVGQ